MFNLLRRRVRRKKNNKNKYNIDAVHTDGDNVPKYSANKHSGNADESGAIATYEHNVEHYRQFLENDDDDEQFASGLATDVVASANVEASITNTNRKTKENIAIDRATIREFKGTASLDEKSTEKSAINAGKIYFENAQQGNLLVASDNFANRNLARLNVVDDDHEGIIEAEIEKVAVKNVKKDEGEQEQRLRQHRRKKVEDMSSDRLACGFSQNELSERQQRILTIGENDKILLDRKTINPSNNLKAFKLLNNFRKTNTTTTTSSSQQVEDVNNDIEICNKQTNSTTSSGQNSTIINEVKYRNTDKTSRNEDKRQSRLSFTLSGINFGKKKVIEERENQEETIEPVLQNNSDQSERKVNDKLGPFEKSRKYLNNLFMARGRHHNRNQRHQQQHLSKQQVNKNVTPTGSSSSGIIAIDKNKQVNQLSTNKIDTNSSSNNEVKTIIPAHLNNSVSSNAYRTPSPINSMQNLQTETKTYINRERALLRSNSATRAREQSLSPQLSKKRSRSVTFSDHEQIIEDRRDTWLDSYNEKFSRSANIERYGGKSLNKTANENFAHNNNKDDEHTHGAVSEERADSATATTSRTARSTTAIEHRFNQTNESVIQSNENNNLNLGNKSEEKDQNNKFNKIGIESNASRRSPTPTPPPILTTSLNRINIMGQTNTKAEPAAREFRESSLPPTAPTDRVKKVSFADIPVEASTPINIKLPSITVADYSGTVNSATATPSEQEVFYDLEYNDRLNDRINIMAVDDDVNDSVFYTGAAATSTSMNDQHSKWQTPNNSAALSQSQMRHNYVKLEDLREEDEDEDESDDIDENNADGEESEEEEDHVKQKQVAVDNDEEEEDDEEEEEEEEESEEESSDVDDRQKRPRHLDNELYNSVERSPLKSSDTTLSGSPSDSGIGTDSQSATPLNVKSRNSPTAFNQTAAVHHQQLRQQLKQQYGYMSFVRDGNSTDCDEALLPCDEIELDLDDENSNERLVCIESISLPDVVVESTTASSSATLSAASSTNSGDHIININGASGNVMGNVHFIPIHVEGASNNNNAGAEGGMKRRCMDDSALGNGTIEITEDASVMNGLVHDNRQTDKLK